MKIVLTRESFESRREQFTTLAPDADWVVLDVDATFDGDPEGSDIVFWGPGLFGDKARAKAMRKQLNDAELKWLQGPSAGVDHMIWNELLARGVRLTNASGMYAEPMAQYINAWVLAWAQGLGGQILRSQHHEWSPLPAEDLTAATIGIVGYGGIGKACARIAKAVGMTVIATRRTPGSEADVDQLLHPDQLHQLLAASDYVAITVPLTDATVGLIGADEFVAMGPQTVLINVARGEVVDEDALSEALHGGTIRGATIDVTQTEPLPTESPLWDVPNLVITPHQSGDGPRAQERLDDLFAENLARYRRGEPLINEVFETGRTAP